MSLAAVMRGPGQLEVAEFPRPEPRHGEVLMRVLLSGVCGTDKHTYRGETKQYAGTAHERDARLPAHLRARERRGRRGGRPGRRTRERRASACRRAIASSPAANVPCGRCHFCLAGAPYYFCENLEDYGNSLGCSDPPHLFGGWAEHMVLLPGTPIFRVPDELPDEVAVLTEPMSVTHGLDTARSLAPGLGGTAFGESVAIVGVGPLGLCHLVKARLTGCGKLIAIDRLPSRLAFAEELGATLTLNVDETDFDERRARILEHTGGLGADIVVDCSGVPETFPEALRLARFGGVVVEAGAFVDLGPVERQPELRHLHAEHRACSGSAARRHRRTHPCSS